MGLEPVVLGALISAIGGGAEAGIGALSQPSGHRKHSFVGTAVDPTRVATQGNLALRDFFNTLQTREPRTLRSAYAQPVPGLTNQDPAFADRSLLSSGTPKRTALQFPITTKELQAGGGMIKALPTPGTGAGAGAGGSPDSATGAAKALLRNALDISINQRGGGGARPRQVA